MKKIYFRQIWLPLLLITHLAYAQTQSNISTPKGSTVTAWLINEMSASDRSYWDSYWASPNRTQLSFFNDGYSSSNRFNCHGYAWSMSEGGLVRWIGAYVTTEEDIYMTDGSYVQVCSEQYPGKVSWADGDHSAITTNVPGRWISKWNKYPLMNHHKDDTPFGYDYRYYVSTAISGSPRFCDFSSNNPYSVQNIPGANYSWTCSSNLTISGSGSSIGVTPVSGASGPAWIEVYISTGCGTATRRRDVTIETVPPPVEYVTVNGGMDPQQMCPGWNAFSVYPYTYMQYEWYLPSDWYCTNTNSGPNPWVCWDIQLDFVSGSPGTVAVRKVNDCGVSDLLYFDVGFNCSTYFTVSPNPARGQVTIDGQGSKMKIKEVRLLDKLGVVKKVTKYSGDNEKATFNTSGLAPGLYYLKIFDGQHWVSKLLSIQ